MKLKRRRNVNGIIVKNATWDYIAIYDKFDLLTKEEEKECVLNKDYDKLVMHNMRLVFSIAFRNCYRRLLPADDLIQEGTIALIKCSRSFDPVKYGKFSSYAHLSIRRAIERAIEENVPVMVPENVIKSLYKKDGII